MNLREPYLAAQKARLVEALETPVLAYSSEQDHGWINLSEENADWSLCARIAVCAIQGRSQAKLVSLVFQIMREIKSAPLATRCPIVLI